MTTLLLFAPNMTDFLIGLFGWETMQVLWAPLECLFNLLNLVFPNTEMWSSVWERLFT